jgi:hypothetical protein
MKITEIIVEGDIPADFNKLDDNHTGPSAIKGALSIPGISMNKSNGSSYAAYRFGLAMAGAPEFPTQAAGAIAGDPLLSTYTDAELEIINFAAKQIGVGEIKKLSTNRSTEMSDTNKQSIAQPRGPIALNRKIKK